MPMKYPCEFSKANDPTFNLGNMFPFRLGVGFSPAGAACTPNAWDRQDEEVEGNDVGRGELVDEPDRSTTLERTTIGEKGTDLTPKVT